MDAFKDKRLDTMESCGNLDEDFGLLLEGNWSPDANSIEASRHVVGTIRDFLEALPDAEPKVHYRIIHDKAFAGSLGSIRCETLEEAIEKRNAINPSEPGKESHGFWEKVKAHSKIIKVTEFCEEVSL